MKHALKTMAFAACITAAATSMAQPPGGGRGGPGGQGGGPGGPGGQGGGPMQHLLDTFNDVDTDKDGKLSKAELQAAMSNQPQGGRGRPGGQGGPPPRDGEQQRGPGGAGGPGGPGGGPGGPGGGPGGFGGPGGPGGERGAPPRPGVVLPDFIMESLGLSDEQKEKLAALQKEVDKQLATILTEDQKKEMESHQPPQHGPGHEEGNREGGNGDRPQRPQRPQ